MTVVTDRTAEAAAPEVTGELRFVAVRVNLLPDEIVAGRRTDVLRRRVLTGLVALVVLLGLGYGFSWYQTHSAQGELESAQAAQASLLQAGKQYAPLVSAKSETSSIQVQLRQLMAGDVSWNSMLTTLRKNAPTGVTVTQVDGTVNAGAAGTGSGPTTPDVLNQTGLQQIGSLTLTGTATDKRTVADYADSLSKVTGLGPAFVNSVTSAAGRTNWTITAPLTTAALGGRYQAKPANGGK